MNRKNMPLLLMLTAGAVTCIITYIRNDSVLAKLVALFVVLLVCFIMGTAMKWTLDYFDRQNEERRKAEGEVIEKEMEDSGNAGESVADGEPEEEPDEDI